MRAPVWHSVTAVCAGPRVGSLRATALDRNDPATDCLTASGVEVQRLATEVGAASSSSPSSLASSQVSDGVSQRSSPTATALKRGLYTGCAVRLSEVKFSTAEAGALAGAPPSSLPTTLAAVGVARFDFGQGSWRGLRWPCCCGASVRRRCAAPGRSRCRGGGGSGRHRRTFGQRCRRNLGARCAAWRASRLTAKPSPATRRCGWARGDR